MHLLYSSRLRRYVRGGGPLLLIALLSTAGWLALRPAAAGAPPIARPDAAALVAIRAKTTAGTVLESRSYEVPANFKGRPKRIFPQVGQYVRRGDILVKGWDHAFAVAPTDAIVLKLLVNPNDYLQPTTPVALLAAATPFRVTLPATTGPHKIGELLRVQSAAAGGPVATVIVLGSVVEGGQCILDLRLRSLSVGPLPAGTAVRVEPLPQ